MVDVLHVPTSIRNFNFDHSQTYSFGMLHKLVVLSAVQYSRLDPCISYSKSISILLEMVRVPIARQLCDSYKFFSISK